MLSAHFVVAALALASSLAAQTIQAPYSLTYGYVDLGSAPGVPTNYGGVTFKRNDPSKLLIGGAANGSAGAIYEIGVQRDSSGRLTGFTGTATQLATAPNIDGGLCYAPNGVLLFTSFSNNMLGQIRPGSVVPDRYESLTPFGVTPSTGTLNFVPAGFPGAGQLKIASYSAGTFYGFTYSTRADGTLDLTAANGPVTIGGGPEGILYVPPGSSQIPDYQYVLINEYSSGQVVLYQVDSVGNPIPATRTPFLTGLAGAEGACTDPISGALVFSTYGGGNRIVVVEGFGVCGAFTGYGTGIAGQNGVPSIQGGGCAGRGQTTRVDITQGRAGAAGLLAVGFLPSNLPFLNGTLLVQSTTTLFHLLDGSGAYQLGLFIPIDPVWNGLNLYSQSFYVDAAAAQGVAATRGLHTLVR
ncbi:MAG: hypothetical protein JNK49_05870 [Planctomycetes bacterium]|nr:hypothetical protein [Planctomycetota bacterium]